MKYLVVKVIFIFSLVASFNVVAKTIAIVDKIKGEVFLLHKDKISKVTEGQMIDDFVELMVSDGAQVSLSDFDRHVFHLSSNSHVKFLNEIIELKAGLVWIQSFEKEKNFSVYTANSVAKFKNGEGIVSFDKFTGKTQLIVIDGEFEFLNSNENLKFEKVLAGYFSFISSDYENGSPRKATPVSFKSFKELLLNFNEIRPVDKYQMRFLRKELVDNVRNNRSLASVANADEVMGNNLDDDPLIPKISFIEGRPAKIKAKKKFRLKSFYRDVLQKVQVKRRKNFKPKYDSKARSVEVQIFGRGSKRKRSRRRTRSMASESGMSRYSGKSSSVNSIDTNSSMAGRNSFSNEGNEFDRSLKEKMKNQKRHSDSVNGLINELESFQLDYKKEY